MKLNPENEMLTMVFMAVLIIVLASALGGCVTKTVYVPSGCPKVNLPQEPHYPMQDLKPGANPATVAKAYAASFGLCMDTKAAIRHVCETYK